MSKSFVVNVDALANEILTDTDIFLYTAICRLKNYEEESLITSLNILHTASQREIKTNKHLLDKYKESLIKLESEGYIKTYSDEERINKHTILIIDIVKSLEYFVVVNRTDIRRLLDIQGVNTFKLLRYYLCKLSTINLKTKIGFTSIRRTCEMAQIINVNTAYTYDKILEDNQLIYIHRHESYFNESLGIVKKPSNTYSRVEDKEKVEEFVNRKYSN